MPSKDLNAFRIDLEDDLYMCYVVVGPETGEAWRIAKRAFGYAPQCNIYRLDARAELDPFLGKSKVDAKAVGFTFSRRGSYVACLLPADAENLDTVLGAIEKALKVKS